MFRIPVHGRVCDWTEENRRTAVDKADILQFGDVPIGQMIRTITGYTTKHLGMTGNDSSRTKQCQQYPSCRPNRLIQANSERCRGLPRVQRTIESDATTTTGRKRQFSCKLAVIVTQSANMNES